MAYNVLVVEDTPDWRTKITGYLIEEEEYNIEEADNYESALKLLRTQPFDVAVVDIRLVDWDEENEQGMELLGELDKVTEENGTQAIVVTGYATSERMREAFRDHRVFDFIEKLGFNPTEFKEIVLKAAEKAFQLREKITDAKYPR